MAFTEEQEEILKRIIEAFQNGKTINDLPDLKLSGDMYNLPIETFIFGESGRIRAGVLNDALNAADKAQLNANIESLMQKTAFADAPMISLDPQCLAGWNGKIKDDIVGSTTFSPIQLSSLRIKNADYYIKKGCRIALFRKIIQIQTTHDYNPDIPHDDDNHYINTKKKKYKGWRFWDESSIAGVWSLGGFRVGIDGKLRYYHNNNTSDITADFLLSYRTYINKSNNQEYMRVLWGAKGKDFPLASDSNQHSPYKFPLALAFCDDEWNIISNIVPFHVLVYYGYPMNLDENEKEIDKWNFCFTY